MDIESSEEALELPTDVLNHKFQKARVFENNNENAQNYRVYNKTRKQMFQDMKRKEEEKKRADKKKHEPLSQLEKDRQLNELIRELKEKKDKETR